MTQFKSTFGIITFVLAIIFLFNSFLAFLLMALVGVLIYPKTSQYIRQKYKLNRILKNTIIVFLFPIGFILGMYHSIVAFDKMIPQQKDSELKIIQLIKPYPLKNIKKTDPNFVFNDYGAFDNEKGEMQRIMDSINPILKSKKLTICGVIQDIENIESNCQRKADLAYPNFDYPEHTNYMEDCIKKEVKAYKKRKSINENLYDKIMYFI